MARKLEPATIDDVNRVRRAIGDLKLVREDLKLAGCREAVAAVRRALKSAEGAERHLWRRFTASNNGAAS